MPDRLGRLTASAVVAFTLPLATTACQEACPRRSSADRPAPRAAAADLATTPPSVPAPPSPLTCWDRATTPEDRDACAAGELEVADRDLNTVYQLLMTDAEPRLRQAVRSAERAWLRYRDSYLSSLEPVTPGRHSPSPADACRSIVLARVTRGRVAELTRMLARGEHDSPTVEASCEGPPAECEGTQEGIEDTYRRLAQSGPPGVRRRLEASQEAWQRYLDAQIAAVMAWQDPEEPSLRSRLGDAVRGRLSLDRVAHLRTFEAYQQDAEERCRRLQAEATILAGFEAKSQGGDAEALNGLGQALQWGWYSIDRDRPRARALYRKACDLGNGSACQSLAHALTTGQGVAKDLAEAARLLERGCDAGDADNCHRLALVHAGGEGVPKDGAKAMALWQHACDLSRTDSRRYRSSGDPCQTLARALESGDPLPRDTTRALAMHEEACERGTGGCVATARLLRKQNRFDMSRVTSLYTRACTEQGDSAACVELGDLLHDSGGSVGAKAALRWYQSACDADFVPGCRGVSQLTGVPMGDPDDPIPDADYIRTVRFVAAEQVPALRLRLFGDTYGTVWRVRVFDEAENRETQEIAVPETPGGAEGATLPLGQVDLNFDGYNDLTLRHYSGANNAGDFIWIFDPESRHFAYCAELSDRPNLVPDPEQQALISYYHFSAGEGSTARYEWIQGKAVRVRAESAQFIEKDGVRCREQVTRELVQGRLVETERSCQ